MLSQRSSHLDVLTTLSCRYRGSFVLWNKVIYHIFTHMNANFLFIFWSMKLFTWPLQRRELSVKYISKHTYTIAHTCMSVHAHTNTHQWMQKAREKMSKDKTVPFLSCVQDPNTHNCTHDDDCFYIALFSALKQTHCARMWFYMSD